MKRLEVNREMLSPMMKQYMEIKDKYSDTILFYRLGDFYEMFFEDAKIVSKELELTLTGKSCGLEERAPMCGIPYHASENYIDVSEIVSEVLEKTRSMSSSAVAEVEFTPSDSKVEIFGALNEFRQLMYNIVLNAFQAMPEGGKLRASVFTEIEAGKRLAKIVISDTGCGIAQEEIDYVFNPFYTRKRIWNSLGLGLSVAYRIAQCMHGDIDIKSEHNVGTTVTVIIPAA